MTTIAERLASALKHHEGGRLQEAEAQYRSILQESPQQAHAWHLLGVLAHQAGRHQEALDLIRRALALQGPHPVFHSNLAAVYLALGRLDEAVAHSQEALRRQPDLADAHNNLGVALRRQGKHDEAVSAFRNALWHNPNHVDARCNLGAALHQQGRFAEALARLQETLQLAPHHAQAHNDLGGVLLACGQTEQAVPYFREAIRLRPNFLEAHTNLGQALRNLNRIDEAMACFREVLRIDPENAAAHNHLGYSLELQGKIEEASAQYQVAWRLCPTNAIALASLGKLAAAGYYGMTDDQMHGLQDLTGRPELSPEDRARAHFALADINDKTDAYDQAFAHYHQANEILKAYFRQRGVVFDLAEVRQFVDRIIAVFTPDYFERVKSFGLATEVPVFIVGMMRSGTTLAEQILASHPRVHGAGELVQVSKLTGTLRQRLASTADYPACAAHFGATMVRTLAGEYRQQLETLGNGAARVVDKFPANFLHLGLIITLFPNARIIHCRRNPLDTCLSCYFQNFKDPLPYTFDLTHLGQYYCEYTRLMQHWAKVLPSPLFDLSYEELTGEPEAISRRLVDFCGLDWDDRCLQFHDRERVVRTASNLQVRRPVSRSSVGRWKHYVAYIQPLHEELRGGTVQLDI